MDDLNDSNHDNNIQSNISPSLVRKYLNNNDNYSYSVDNSPSLSANSEQYLVASADIYTWKLKKSHDGKNTSIL